MGYIRQKSNGTYSFTVSLGLDPITNKYKQKSIGGFKGITECKKAMRAMEASIDKGEYFEANRMLLCDYLKQWLEHVSINVEETTHVFYKAIVDKAIIPELGNIKLDKLGTMHVQSFLDNKVKVGKLSKNTVKHYYNVLSIALNRAVEWELILKNPCKKVQPPKPDEIEVEVLTPVQAVQLINYTKTSEFKIMYIPIMLAITCGMRRGEALGLRWENVDLERGILYIKDNYTRVGNLNKMKKPKSDKSERPIMLLPTVIEALKEHRKEQEEINKVSKVANIKNEYVCTWPDGVLIRPDYVTKTTPKLLKKCALPNITFHDLRHTHGTLLSLLKTSPKYAAERMGHSKVDFYLDTYTHTMPEMQLEAVIGLENILFKK